MRAFLAIVLPDEVVDAIGRLQARLPVGRAVPRDNLHLTLAFLDDQPEERLEALHEALQARQSPSFDVVFEGLGCFGGRHPKVLFAAVRPQPALIALHDRAGAAARRAGIAPGKGRYRPHVTLARFGRGLSRAGAARLAGFVETDGDTPLPGFRAARFALFRSTLRHDGAVHEELASYPLAAADI